jgi:hypothetical protein
MFTGFLWAVFFLWHTLYKFYLLDFTGINHVQDIRYSMKIQK